MTALLPALFLPSAGALAVNPGLYGQAGVSSSNYSEYELDDVCDALGFYCSVDNGNLGYRVGFGCQFKPFFAVGGGYVSMADITVSPANLLGISYEADGPYVSLVGSLPLGQGGFSLLGTAGMSRLSSKISVGGIGIDGSVDDTVTVPAFGPGGAFNSRNGGFSVRFLREIIDMNES